MTRIQNLEPCAGTALLRSAKRCAAVFVLCLANGHSAFANTPVDVALAGLAFSGAADTIAKRFPYSKRYEDELKNAGTPVWQQLMGLATKGDPPALPGRQ